MPPGSGGFIWGDCSVLRLIFWLGLCLASLPVLAEENPTAGHALEQGIDVPDVRPPLKRSRRDHLTEVWWLCFNAHWQTDPRLDWQDAGRFLPFSQDHLWLLREDRDAQRFFYHVRISVTPERECHVSFARDGAEIRVEIGGQERLFVDMRNRSAQRLNLFAPTALLSDIIAQGKPRNLSRRLLLRRVDTRQGVCKSLFERRQIDIRRCDRTYSIDPASGQRRYTFQVEGAPKLVLTDGPQGARLNDAPVTLRHMDGPLPAHDLCVDQTDGDRSFCYGLE